MRRGLALLSALQRAVDGAHRHRLRQGQPSPGDAGLHGVDRAGLDQHDHRRGRGDDQPPAGAAVPLRLLRNQASGAGAPAARAPDLGRSERQRLLPAGQPVLRPDHPPGADPDGAARGDARADRPGRDGGRHDRAAAGHPGSCIRLSRAFLPRAALAHRAARARPGTHPRGESPCSRRPSGR